MGDETPHTHAHRCMCLFMYLTTDSVVPLTLAHSISRALNSFCFFSSFLHSTITLCRCCYARLFVGWFVRSYVRLMFSVYAFESLLVFFSSSFFNISSLSILPSLLILQFCFSVFFFVSSPSLIR